jgi:3D (Asp-Asp-Asp) domain-containing protein
MNQDQLGKLAIWISAAALALIGVSLCSCATQSPGNRHPRNPKSQTARVTFYNPHEDRFGSRVAIGGRAHEGTTMAAPAAIPFGTHVSVPGLGEFVVQDRGSALEKAYRRGELRLDVYVATRKRMRQLQYGMPEYEEVEIQ